MSQTRYLKQFVLHHSVIVIGMVTIVVTIMVLYSALQVEWMSDKLMRCFEDKRNNPFQFRHLSLCHSLADLARVPSPKVVLCSQPDLESGFSRELFIQWCQDAKNSVILTYRTTPGTLGRYLIDNPGEKMLDLEVKL